MSSYTVYCDGGSRGNPGPAASAFVVIEGKSVVHEDSFYLGKATNNVAEYEAVYRGLLWFQHEGKKKLSIKFVVDSQLVAKQLSGEFKIKSDHLKLLADKIKKLERSNHFRVAYLWTERARNKRADRLVNEKLDEVLK